jgi:glycosyltransferase involved in cell wall biosynthesis
VIVVDDASSDGTPEVLAAFGNTIRLVQFAENQGANAARNHGASLATGEYLVFLDGDDALMPCALQVYERLVAAYSPKIILGQRFYFRGDVPTAASAEVPRRIDFVNYPRWFERDRMVAVGASTSVINRTAFWDVGGWSPGIFHLDIVDLLVKLGLSGTTLLILAPKTVWYRIHSANVTHAAPAFLRCAHAVLEKERAGGYPGGRKHLFARSACLGGPILYWIRRGVRAGLYSEALKLAGPAWFTIAAAFVRRVLARCSGRRPAQTVALLPD